jgi:hypothetical protein
MKTLRVCGWAVIFTVTLLLAACASHTPKVADTDMMSGPDATMIQPAEKQTLERWENALVIRQAWLNERESQLDQREATLDRRENAVAITRAWLDERETQLDEFASHVELQENALVINQAWLKEHEARLAEQGSGLTLQSAAVVADTGSPRTKVEAGHCYATVVYPAEYKTVTVTKPIESPQGENLPVLYKTVTEKVKVTDDQVRWTEVLCDSDMSECRISEIQRALYRGGYNPGPIDGIVGQQTMAAVNAFQKDFNLTVADYLTVETVRALDANF